jgi:hypothetical protein
MAQDALPGWMQHARVDGTSIGPNTTHKFSGEQSLRIVSRGPVAWVRSDPFPTPRTGQISVLVRVKTSDPKRQPALRLAVEGKLLNGKTYYTFTNVGTDAVPLSDDWGKHPFLFRINDLPVSQLAYVQVGFDLMGAGDVWIDDVQVFDRWFLPNERDELMIMTGLAARSLSDGQIADCQRILSAYWSQFLMEFVPLNQPRVAAVPANDAGNPATFPPPQTKTPDKEASVLDKVKQVPKKIFPYRLR